MLPRHYTRLKPGVAAIWEEISAPAFGASSDCHDIGRPGDSEEAGRDGVCVVDHAELDLNYSRDIELLGT